MSKSERLLRAPIGTIRRECLDWIIPLSESHLRLVIREWAAHYNVIPIRNLVSNPSSTARETRDLRFEQAKNPAVEFLRTTVSDRIR